MCGRFTLTFERDRIEDYLQLPELPADYAPRYNVAPTQLVAVTRDFTAHKVEWMRWGLIPSWANDPSIGVRMINARSESLLDKSSFREAFQKRRCLILADGFYEWQKLPGKQPSIPHYFTMSDKRPFFFAGLWDTWHSPAGENLTTCTIITGAPNELVQPIHDRMPVLFDVAKAWQWLDPSASTNTLQTLFSPYPAEKMSQHAVSPLVNQAGLEIPDLIKEI